MKELDEFMAVYDAFAGSRELYMSLKELTKGIPRWRLHVLEKNTAPNGGDREILCVEHKDKRECLIMATERLKRRMREFQVAVP